MYNLTVSKEYICIQALDYALRQALGEKCYGLSFDQRVVTVHLIDEITEEDKGQATTIVESHNAAFLTAERRVADVDVLVWVPYGTPGDEVTLTVNGVSLPDPLALVTDPRMGGSVVIRLVLEESAELSVIEFPCESVVI